MFDIQVLYVAKCFNIFYLTYYDAFYLPEFTQDGDFQVTSFTVSLTS